MCTVRGGMEVPDDAGTRRAVEFVAPAISSPPLATNSPQLRALVEGASKVAPHVKYANGDHNGYLLVELGRDSAEASWWFTGNRTQRNADAEKSKTLICETGTHQLS